MPKKRGGKCKSKQFIGDNQFSISVSTSFELTDYSRGKLVTVVSVYMLYPVCILGVEVASFFDQLKLYAVDFVDDQ